MSARRLFLTLTMLFGLAICGSSGASAQAVQFVAVMDGENEVDGTIAAVGDPNGYGIATVLLGASGQLCFSILVRGIDTPNAAHIHEASAGHAGPIVVSLTAPAAGDPGTSAGCHTGQSVSVLSRLRSTPRNSISTCTRQPFHPARSGASCSSGHLTPACREIA